jgi:hypothetical protein
MIYQVVLAAALLALVASVYGGTDITITGPSCTMNKYLYSNKTTMSDISMNAAFTGGTSVNSETELKYLYWPCPTSTFTTFDKNFNMETLTTSFTATSGFTCANQQCTMILSATATTKQNKLVMSRANSGTGSKAVHESLLKARSLLNREANAAAIRIDAALKANALNAEAPAVKSELSSSSSRIHAALSDVFAAQRELELMATAALADSPDVLFSSEGVRMAIDFSMKMTFAIGAGGAAPTISDFVGKGRASAYMVGMGLMAVYEYTPSAANGAFDPNQAPNTYTQYQMTNAQNPFGVFTVAVHNQSAGNNIGSYKASVTRTVASKGSVELMSWMSPTSAAKAGGPTVNADEIKVGLQVTNWQYDNGGRSLAFQVGMIGRTFNMYFQMASMDNMGTPTTVAVPAALFTKSGNTVSSAIGDMEFESTVTNGGNSYNVNFGNFGPCTEGFCAAMKTATQAQVYEAYFSVLQSGLQNFMWDPQAKASTPASVPVPQNTPTQSSLALSSAVAMVLAALMAMLAAMML